MSKGKLCKNFPKMEETSQIFTESQKLLVIQKELCNELEKLELENCVEYVYNPLEYAKNIHETFVKKYFETSTKKIIFLGMNPGPWGMCQSGIPFGEKNYVREWFGINGSVGKPKKEHPKKKVAGLDCHRSEGSGKKFWGFFKNHCLTPENFFKHSFVYNLCPLAFLNASGNNITPPEIKDFKKRKLLYEICDKTFIKIIREFDFEIVIGIGKFAEKCAIKALKSNGILNVKVTSIPHPSPRNRTNISNWDQKTFEILQQNNLLKYFSSEILNIDTLLKKNGV